MEQALPLLVLQKGQQTRDAVFDALDQIGEALPGGGHELGDIRVRGLAGQTREFLGGKVGKRSARGAQGMLQNKVEKTAALERRQLGPAARADAQHVLQEI